ncbi:metallophosphoesterase family protein [Pseudothermotoga thermarum]|uniref:Metallophosphoesterase n=1 Tax=Pseudothermotoga thermarum DSM 5069 TaxID=688269 RepID=F7YYA5_9THEM|nr:metallophosphoesterase family protein [Pseudothermotoga thermarum]AEH50926.1 metallophosphoesterase [Pseudothermotoga thermarum DSM 5069]
MTYVVGDIHGCLWALDKLVKKLPLASDDTLIFLGDYVDRGPDSKGVIDYLIGLSKFHNCVFLRGNHEQMMLACLEKGQDCYLWEFNGANATIRSYGGIKSIPQQHIEFLKNTRLYYVKDKFIFVHAGLKPGVPLENQDPFDLVWIRDEFIYSQNPAVGYKVVFGHTPFANVLILPDKIGVDTGCVYGGKLSCIRIEDYAIFQVECERK